MPFERLVIFSRDELKQYEMEQTLTREKVEPRCASSSATCAISRAWRWRCATSTMSIHAAALKQVPAAEYNPFECIHTNVLGAENVVRAALRNQVKRVIALSTDKAVQSDQSLRRDQARLRQDLRRRQSSQRLHQGALLRRALRQRRRLARQVVPLFRKLIAEGADSLPITDERMTRFWITLREGVDFVLSCLDMMRGGEIFVPKIPSMKMIDLAQAMAPDLPAQDRRHPAGREAARGDDHRGRRPHHGRDGRPLRHRAGVRLVGPPTFEGPSAKRVADDFRYASDTNPEWLKPEQLRTMLTDKD